MRSPQRTDRSSRSRATPRPPKTSLMLFQMGLTATLTPAVIQLARRLNGDRQADQIEAMVRRCEPGDVVKLTLRLSGLCDLDERGR